MKARSWYLPYTSSNVINRALSPFDSRAVWLKGHASPLEPLEG